MAPAGGSDNTGFGPEEPLPSSIRSRDPADLTLTEIRALILDRPAGAARLLGRRGGRESIALLGELLGHPRSYVRHHAALGLGRIGGPSVLEHLTPALRDADWRVATAACIALKRADVPGVQDLFDQLLPELREQIKSSNANVVNRAFMVLTEMRTPASMALMKRVWTLEFGDQKAKRILGLVLRFRRLDPAEFEG